MKYATLRRIGEAQNLLINTDMTITSIAAQIGYNNSNYFQNVFRNAVGISPGEYRRQWTQ
jgi:AraC-like DNA-binding protein